MADANPSTEPAPAPAGLGRWERLAALGIALSLVSLPLPWYRVSFDDRLSQSGLSNVGFADLALLITLGAAGMLLYRVATGNRPPLPLHVGTLLAIAGAWGALIVGVLAFDRPVTTVEGLEVDYRLGYGIFICFGGAALVIVAGLRLRKTELAREAKRRRAEEQVGSASSSSS